MMYLLVFLAGFGLASYSKIAKWVKGFLQTIRKK